MNSISNWNKISPEKLAAKFPEETGKVVLGLDGIIDQVWQMVKERMTPDKYQLFEKIEQFGKVIVERKSGGLSHEIIEKRRSSGGFTSNTGRALGRLKVDTYLVGMYGKERTDKVFADLTGCQLISHGEPIITHIFEFDDGKIMLPHLEHYLSISWDYLLQKLGKDKLKKIYAGAELISIGYWSNMPYFDDLLDNLYRHILSIDPPSHLFFDFGNPAKKGKKAYMKTMELLKRLECKIPVTVSLNENEAGLLYSYYGYKYKKELEPTAESLPELREKLDLSEIIIHSPHYALLAREEGLYQLSQDCCLQPSRTVGAGDNFNSGYITGCLIGAEPLERLALANGLTSYYVRNGFPPVRRELFEEILRIKRKLLKL